MISGRLYMIPLSRATLILTLVALVAKVAVLVLQRPAKGIARIGVICGGGIEDAIHNSWVPGWSVGGGGGGGSVDSIVPIAQVPSKVRSMAMHSNIFFFTCSRLALHK